MQNSDSGSMTFCSKAGSSSQKTSPFHEIVTYAPELLSSSSLGSSPDDNSSDGIKLHENEVWQFRLAYATKWPGVVLKICPYLDRYFLATAGNAVSSKTVAFSPFILSLAHCPCVPSFPNSLSKSEGSFYLLSTFVYTVSHYNTFFLFSSMFVVSLMTILKE